MKIATIITAAEQVHKLPSGSIVGKSKKAALVRARFQAMQIAHDFLGADKSKIGRAFGGRDHTTVINALRKPGGDRWREEMAAVLEIAQRDKPRFFRHASAGEVK